MSVVNLRLIIKKQMGIGNPIGKFKYVCNHGNEYTLKPIWTDGWFSLRCGCQVTTKKLIEESKL